MAHPRLTTQGIETLTDNSVIPCNDGEVVFALREGISYDGSRSFPYVSLWSVRKNSTSILHTYVGITLPNFMAGRTPEGIIENYLDLSPSNLVANFVSEITPRKTNDGLAIGSGRIYLGS